MAETYEPVTKKLPPVKASIRYIPTSSKTSIYEHIVGPSSKVLETFLGICRTGKLRDTVSISKASLSEGGEWNGKSVLYAQLIFEWDSESTPRDRDEAYYLGSLYVPPKAQPPEAIAIASLPQDMSSTVVTPQNELVEEEVSE